MSQSKSEKMTMLLYQKALKMFIEIFSFYLIPSANPLVVIRWPYSSVSGNSFDQERCGYFCFYPEYKKYWPHFCSQKRVFDQISPCECEKNTQRADQFYFPRAAIAQFLSTFFAINKLQCELCNGFDLSREGKNSMQGHFGNFLQQLWRDRVQSLQQFKCGVMPGVL